MNLRACISKLERDYGPPRCEPGRVIVGHREGEPEPVPPPCPVCGDPLCGAIIITEVIVTSREEVADFRERAEFAAEDGR